LLPQTLLAPYPKPDAILPNQNPLPSFILIRLALTNAGKLLVHLKTASAFLNFNFSQFQQLLPRLYNRITINVDDF
jgi:hypothetical protein